MCVSMCMRMCVCKHVCVCVYAYAYAYVSHMFIIYKHANTPAGGGLGAKYRTPTAERVSKRFSYARGRMFMLSSAGM
jgi:hypothetical protein